MPEALVPLSDTGSILGQKDKQWDHGQLTMNHRQCVPEDKDKVIRKTGGAGELTAYWLKYLF